MNWLTPFVWSIRTYPDLVVFGIPSLLNVVQNYHSVLLSFDTTFNVGDFYLSVLALKLPVFDKAPTIPIAFVIHDRKFEAVHYKFCQELRRHLPGGVSHGRRSSNRFCLRGVQHRVGFGELLQQILKCG